MGHRPGVQYIQTSTATMRSLLVLAALALQAAWATPLGTQLLPQARANLLCGNYSINPDQSLFIKSKNFAQNYPKNHDCSYTFHCTDYAASLILNCSRFELQGAQGGKCKKDFMRVYDDNGINRKYCGTTGPQDVITGENFLGVRFKTNGDSTRGSGFFCKVKCVHVDDKTTSTTTAASTSSTSTTTTQTPASTTTTTAAPVPTPATAYSGCRGGIAKRSTRIVGGNETEVGEYPWQVGLYTDMLQTPFCGGSLVNNLYVVTAAHCLDSSNFKVILGEHDWTKVSRVYVRDPQQITIHPDYNSNTFENDIAVIKLSSPVNLNADIPVKPVCLPDPSSDFTGMKAIATGWGLTSEAGNQATALQEVEVTVYSEADCSAGSSTMLCAGEPEGGKDTCQGVSGGPLVVEVDGQYV